MNWKIIERAHARTTWKNLQKNNKNFQDLLDWLPEDLLLLGIGFVE